MLIFQNMIKEKNTVFFSGISNVDFSKYEQPPHPTPPSSPSINTRASSFSCPVKVEITISGNLTRSISDHLPVFHCTRNPWELSQ